MLSVKQGGIKFPFFKVLWYDSTWDWTQVLPGHWRNTLTAGELGARSGEYGRWGGIDKPKYHIFFSRVIAFSSQYSFFSYCQVPDRFLKKDFMRSFAAVFEYKCALSVWLRFKKVKMNNTGGDPRSYIQHNFSSLKPLPLGWAAEIHHRPIHCFLIWTLIKYPFFRHL